jgi:hypothetical protein
MILTSLVLLASCFAILSRSAVVSRSQQTYTTSIKRQFEHKTGLKFTRNKTVELLIRAILVDPQDWTLRTIKAVKPMIDKDNGRVCGLDEIVGVIEIGETCQARHPRSDALKLLCQFEEGLASIDGQDIDLPFSSVFNHSAFDASDSESDDGMEESNESVCEADVVMEAEV